MNDLPATWVLVLLIAGCVGFWVAVLAAPLAVALVCKAVAS